MPEQLEIPQGTPLLDKVADPNPQGFPTFGDLPETNPVGTMPRITFAEDELEVAPADEPVTTPGPETASPPTPEYSPPSGVAPTGVGSGQELFQVMAALDDYKDQKRMAQERERSTKEWEPPKLSETEAEEIMSSPEKFRAYQAARDKWHRDAAVGAIQPVMQTVQSLQNELNGIRYRQHQEAWQEVREVMQEKGINADSYYGQVDSAIRSNPNTYWTIATDPRALKTAVEMLHSNAAPTNFTATPQTPKEPPTAGRSSAPPTRTESASTYTHPAIEQAERVFGKKFSKQMREEFRRTINQGRV